MPLFAGFKAAFNSQFEEGQTQTYHLEDTTENAIRLLINWVYTQNLDVREPENLPDQDSTDEDLIDEMYS